jgi:hypothetical protein
MYVSRNSIAISAKFPVELDQTVAGVSPYAWPSGYFHE